MTKTKNENDWFYLDPDNRIDPPKDTIIYCCRCQRKRGNMLPVELSSDGLYVRKTTTMKGNAYLGTDCYNKVFNSNPTSS